ncbi:MAG: DUF2723 domain-containing protein [Caldilineaceae bacterium]|nr:DUF2723 domain-containing protein [Caldilineaceae bacterium]
MRQAPYKHYARAQSARTTLFRLISSSHHLVIFLFSFTLYLTTLAPGLLGGDAGELQFAPAILALPHPSGYPVQVLLNWLWIQLFPLGEIAWRINLLSALVAALGVTAVGWTVHRSTGSTWAALIAGTALATAPVYWSQAVLADKYALNGLLTALLLAAAWHFGQRVDRRSLLWLAFVGGLAFAHHRSLWLFAPVIGVWILVRGWPILRRPSALIGGIIAFTAPLLVYFYVVWAAGRPLPPAFGIEMDWPRFWRFVLSDGSAGQVRLGLDWAGLQLYAGYLLESYPWPWLLLVIVGVILRMRERGRRGWLIFLLAAFVSAAYLSAVYENYDLPRRYVYFVPSYVALALLIGEGWQGILSAMPQTRLRPLFVGMALLLAFAPLIALPARWQSFRAEQFHERPLDIWRQTLKSGGQADRLAAGLALVEPDALIAADWEQATPLWYAQQVEGHCPGCLIRYPLHELVNFAGQAAAEDRPLYVARTVNDATLWSHPTATGPLVKLASQPEDRLPADLDARSFTFDGQLDLAGIVWPLGDPVFEPGRVLPLSLIWQRNIDGDPLPGYAISLRLDGPVGEVWQSDSPAPVLGMAPFSSFAPGVVVADYYEIPIPADAAPGEYTLRLILYTVADGGFRNAPVTAAGMILGEQAEILKFGVER